VPHNTTIALVTAVIHHQRPSHDSGQRPAGSAQGADRPVHRRRPGPPWV